MTEVVTLIGESQHGARIELPVNVTSYGPNLLTEPDPNAPQPLWSAQDGSITAMEGYLYWDESSSTIAQHYPVAIESGKTYELRFEGLIYGGAVEVRLLSSGADPIVVQPDVVYGIVGTFEPTASGDFSIRFVDDGDSAGRVKNFQLREVLGS